MLGALDPSASVLDLYCGIGTIGSFIAGRSQTLHGVDSVGQAIADAKQAAQRNGFTDAHFTTAKAEIWLPKWLQKGNRADVAIIDPPRKGCDRKLLDALVDARIPRILYISCNPATLARDLKLLAPAYRLAFARPVDMFPQTGHVETVCQLVLRKPAVYINIDVDVEELVQDKRGAATYGQIKDYVLEHSGLKVSSLYIAQVKQKYGIIERENYNKPKSEDAKQPQCPPEKEKAIRAALQHFRLIE